MDKPSDEVQYEEALELILEVLPECSRERALNALKKYGDPTEALASLMDETNKDDINDRVALLMDVFPHLSPDLIRNAVEQTRDNDEAYTILKSHSKEKEQRKSAFAQPSPVADPQECIKELISMFPDKGFIYLQGVLNASNNNFEEAVNKVLSGFEPQPSQPVSSGPSASPESTIPENTAPSVPLGLNSWLNRPYRIDEKMKAVFDELVFDLDTTKPSQSLLCLKSLKSDALGGVKEHLFIDGGCGIYYKDEELAQHVMSCFEQMLKREQELHQDFVVFYHSYSYAHILYEVQSVLASILLGASDDCPPLPRLLFKPFDGIPSLDFLLEESLRSNDAGDKYRNCAICVSNSLFAYTSEAPPVSFFVQGYCANLLDFKSMLAGLFREIGIDEGASESAAKSIFKSARKYCLPTRMDHCFGRRRCLTGHMLQIFIKRSEVDNVAYDSLPYGAYTLRGPISQLLTVKETSVGDGQARVFVHPELLLNPSRSRVFYYSSSPEFSENRAAFREEIKHILIGHFSTLESTKNAACRIRAIPVIEEKVTRKEETGLIDELDYDGCDGFDDLEDE